MGVYLNLGYNQTLLHFMVQMVPALGSGSSSSWLLCPFSIHHHFFLKNTFLLSGTTRYSRLILYVSPCPEPAISPQSPCSFYYRMALEINIWVLSMLIDTGVWLILGLVS